MGVNFSPLTLPGVSDGAVFDASVGTSDTGGALDSWVSTNGIYTLTASAGDRPTLMSADADFANRPTVDASGTNVMTGPAALAALFNGDDIVTEFAAVMLPANAAGADYIFGASDGGDDVSWRLSAASGQVLTHEKNATLVNASTAIDTSNALLYGLAHSGSAATHYRGVTSDGSGASDVAAHSGFDTFRLFTNHAGSQFITLDLAYLIIAFPAVPWSAATRAQLHGWAQAQFGVA